MNIVAAVICIIAPLIMANQEWDDHDRSQKTLARDQARNYLESCAPNAILFTFGDNDTYPLWYAQEVEKVRPDIRIINTSLLGIDWYINQLRYKINQSDPIDVIWTPAQIIGENRQYMQYAPPPNVSKDSYFDLYDVMKNVLGQGDNVVSFPVKKFKVPVDSVEVKKNGTLNADDVVTGDMLFETPGNDLTRDQLIILNIIAANGWKRPIYFTSPYNELGFQDYLRKDGITYRLVPIRTGSGINTDWMMNNLMTKFTNGNADKKGVYFDEENRRHLIGLRQAYSELARELVTKNRKEDAIKVLKKIEAMIPETNVPYGMPSRYEMHNQASYFLMEAANAAGYQEYTAKIAKAVSKDMDEQMNYYAALGDNMSRQQLDDIMKRYSQMKFTAQNAEQQNQAEIYLRNNLNNNQVGLAYEMSRGYELYQFVQRRVTENNALKTPTDTLQKPGDSNTKKTDTPASK